MGSGFAETTSTTASAGSVRVASATARALRIPTTIAIALCAAGTFVRGSGGRKLRHRMVGLERELGRFVARPVVVAIERHPFGQWRGTIALVAPRAVRVSHLCAAVWLVGLSVAVCGG
jgi:hypothetical protein